MCSRSGVRGGRRTPSRSRGVAGVTDLRGVGELHRPSAWLCCSAFWAGGAPGPHMARVVRAAGAAAAPGGTRQGRGPRRAWRPQTTRASLTARSGVSLAPRARPARRGNRGEGCGTSPPPSAGEEAGAGEAGARVRQIRGSGDWASLRRVTVGPEPSGRDARAERGARAQSSEWGRRASPWGCRGRCPAQALGAGPEPASHL